MSAPLWRMVRLSVAGEDEDADYAQPESAGGTSAPRRCPECDGPVPWPRPAQPLILEWSTRDPLVLGDFTWPAATYLPLVARPLADELRERFGGLALAPVEVRERVVRWSDGKPGRQLPAAFLEQARGLTVIEGVEYWGRGMWDPVAKRLPRTQHPREPGRGLYVGGGAGFFALDKDPKFVLCTDEVKRFVEERRLTNVAFLRAGELVP